MPLGTALFQLKMYILTFFLDVINLEEHLNCCTDSKVMAILRNGLILPTGGVALGRSALQPAQQAFYTSAWYSSGQVGI